MTMKTCPKGVSGPVRRFLMNPTLLSTRSLPPTYRLNFDEWLFREPEDKAAKMRRAVRANNFTQQTNALDVDKHMYALPTISFLSSLGN